MLVTLTRSECLELLGTESVGRVVVSIGPGTRPLIRPVNYVFDTLSQSVVFRSEVGTKLFALTHSPRASFEVDAIDPARRTGWSVIIEGATERVVRPMELRRLEQLALHAWVASPEAPLIRIRARTVSGRRITPGAVE
jgi:nitroimidazol reductase NimA-like FMN-containing flavoprotein (pyridoxamine 5'-phosphate oxidase superfamily)